MKPSNRNFFLAILLFCLVVFFFLPFIHIERSQELYDYDYYKIEGIERKTLHVNKGDSVYAYYSADKPLDVFIFRINEYMSTINDPVFIMVKFEISCGIVNRNGIIS